MTKEINKELIDTLFASAQTNERKRINYDLRTSSNDTSQRMLNALMPGTEVPIHRHESTSETVICLCGKMEEIIYDAEVVVGGDGAEELKFNERSRHMLCPEQGLYGVQVPMGVWHTVNVIEPSVIFEAKDGAYIPAK